MSSEVETSCGESLQVPSRDPSTSLGMTASFFALFYPAMRLSLLLASGVLIAASARAQIQVDLKLKRLQYISHEPVMATLGITNLTGRDIDLRDGDGESWFGFEVTAKDGQLVALLPKGKKQPPLNIESGKKVSQRIDLTSLYPVQDFGTYHVRAHVYFADLGKFFYSPTKIFEVTDARPIWQKTVGIPEGVPGPGNVRTYSLLSNRFPDHTSLYVRVEDKDQGIVYATYSLGHAIAFDEPQTVIDRANQLHVLHCAAPRTWAYSRIGLNGELLAHSSFMETKTRPRLLHAPDGDVSVRGGMLDQPAALSAHGKVPKLSERPAEIPKDD